METCIVNDMQLNTLCVCALLRHITRAHVVDKTLLSDVFTVWWWSVSVDHVALSLDSSRVVGLLPHIAVYRY